MLLTFFLGKRQRKAKPPQNNEREYLHQTIIKIQQGEDDLRDDILAKYQPFIGKAVGAVCKRYISQQHDEEFNVGMEAFNEAITQYTSSKGSSFLSFADLVIRRRVIDYIRKNKPRVKAVSFDEGIENENSVFHIWDAQASMANYWQACEADYRREEVLHYKERLLDFNISFEELPDYTPKHADARSNMVEIARVIAMNSELKEAFLQKKKIPVKKLLQFVAFSRKTVERNRNYIVAITLILLEDYRYLRSYIQLEEVEEGKGGEHFNEKGDCATGMSGLLDRDDSGRGIL